MSSNLICDISRLDWDCTEADTQYLTHSIHRYSGKFIPQIARQAIELLTKPGDTILDPYCGSGTTSLEAALLNRKSIGIDLNPLAILIAKVKTTPISPERLKQFQQSLELNLTGTSEILWGSPSTKSLFSSFQSSEDYENIIQSDARWHDQLFQKWFQEIILKELIVLDHIIHSEEDITLRRVAVVAFSDILRKCSNAHGGYPNLMFDKNKGTVQPAIPQFLKRFGEIVNQICELENALKGKPQPNVVLSDNTNLPLVDSSIDAVITHPPYISSIPYAEYGFLSLIWLGTNPKELDQQLTGGRRHSKDVVSRFREGFCKIISETYRVLKSEGKFFMLLGNPTVDAQRIDLSSMAEEMASNKNFKLIAKYQRKGMNRRANLMGREDLLFFQK